ncbi:hypothetical protein BKH46_02105 [Helicobacter sp. 12S02634-8]|uniref:YggT family protein n=1 Tax=Helicobacter sp. 12S02634-8 TaxID=1476199 RepID=UPI000BA6D09C|nr:YggT family protein [Helicobacter sp. 12S02634-8]PAF48126.1 hypothetical protein BKH46_02105 [Helicobacter sp. 12S02634-8]
MILSSILEALGSILHILITLYTWVVIISALITWVRPDPFNPIVVLLTRLTEPLYSRLKAKLPLVFNGIDFTPLVVIVILQFLDMTLVKILLSYAARLQ